MAHQPLTGHSLSGGEIVPCYLLEHDHPWLRALLDEYRRFEGRPRQLLADRLRDPLVVAAPADKLRIARHVLDRTWCSRSDAAVAPKRARAAVFGAAAQHASREAALSHACAELGLDRAALMRSLFADLESEKLLAPPTQPISPAELAQRANLALVARMIQRAAAVRIAAEGNVRPLVRQAKLHGLLCTVTRAVHTRDARDSASVLHVSGPYALFRRTLLYGRALASLVPFAAWCDRMELQADCALDPAGPCRTLVIRSGDPLFPRPEPARFDSLLEERFARDFAALAPEWDVIREPEALPAEGTLIFPDFELRHRRDPARRWLLEIIGFWTPEYVKDKLRRLRRAALERVILCIDEERNCGDEELPATARVVRFRRKIDAARVAAIVGAGR